MFCPHIQNYNNADKKKANISRKQESGGQAKKKKKKNEEQKGKDNDLHTNDTENSKETGKMTIVCNTYISKK